MQGHKGLSRAEDSAWHPHPSAQQVQDVTGIPPRSNTASSGCVRPASFRTFSIAHPCGWSAGPSPGPLSPCHDVFAGAQAGSLFHLTLFPSPACTYENTSFVPGLARGYTVMGLHGK